MDNNISELFKLDEGINDLLSFAQFEHTIKAPTSKGFTDIVLQLLWEEEELEVVKFAGKETNPQDLVTVSEIIKIETLVRSIKKIGDMKFYVDPDDENVKDVKDEEKILRNKLRGILNVSSPALVQYLYDMYTELSNKRNEFVEKATDDLKKNFREKLLDIKPL